ncbi:hypothetical protein OYC64_020055 [Pagothenia borchgrevinki]|uniref:Transmembrane protein 174 n=2 Tax=Pagothenia borchgrevinki TaxID=8213 RepID=A0ABD2FJZ6_PAGBO
MLQRPVMESNQVRHPAHSDSLQYNKKSGVFLLFSGVFLGLAGATLTTMGWYHYPENSNFGWTQFLGPILISIGGTFMLISFYRFGVVYCWPCRQLGEGAPAMDQTSIGPSIILSGINPPIMLHNATAIFHLPPQYDFITREVHQAAGFQSGRCLSGVHAAPSPHSAGYCVDNAAFTAEEEETEHRRSRIGKTEDESPPRYEDIYPSFF